MTHWILALALALFQIPPDATGGRTPVERDHIMDEAEADSLVSRTGAGVAVRVDAVEGVPAEAAARAAFLEGFRQAFLAKEYAAERVARRSGAVSPAAALRARVRLTSGEEDDEAWGARVRLEWLVPADSAADSLARAWPGVAVRATVVLEKPEEGPDARVTPPAPAVPVTLRFPTGHPVDEPYMHNAGRGIGLLVVEAVARARGDLPEDRRLALDDARRLGPGGGR